VIHQLLDIMNFGDDRQQNLTIMSPMYLYRKRLVLVRQFMHRSHARLRESTSLERDQINCVETEKEVLGNNVLTHRRKSQTVCADGEIVIA
jgi:hypothetical protein